MFKTYLKIYHKSLTICASGGITVRYFRLSRRCRFKFTDYDCIGLDLDNTICEYNLQAFMTMEYNAIAELLIKKKSFYSKHLLKPIDEDFFMRGLFLDTRRGNLLQIDPSGNILSASHGTRPMTEQEWAKVYGPENSWEPTKEFVQNPLITWDGTLSTQMRPLLDYFDVPASLLFARMVDAADEREPTSPKKEYDVHNDIIDSFTAMFTDFYSKRSTVFAEMRKNPKMYYKKGSAKLLDWMKVLRYQQKIVVLITSSGPHFASFTAEFALGSDWKNYFDVIIYAAKKPGFFYKSRPFMKAKTEEKVEGKNLRKGEYINGNFFELVELLKRLTEKKDPKFVYIGDNIIADIFSPNFYSGIDTVLVCDELIGEEFYTLKGDFKPLTILRSKRWGSLFTSLDKKFTIWKALVVTHSQLGVHSMEYIASHPPDYEYGTSISRSSS